MKTGLRLLSILLLIVVTFNNINTQKSEDLSRKEAKVIEGQADISYEEEKLFRPKLITKGYGEENPIATNDTDDGKQKNRRTEFKILKGK